MNYFVKRVLQAGITTLGVITFTFVLIRYMPGGPMDYVRAELARTQPGANPEQINALAELYIQVNPDEPIYIQYVDYVSSVLMGDLGHSIWYGEPVSAVISQALPWTAFVMGASLIISFTIAILVGSLMGYYEGNRFDKSLTFVSITLNAVPYYIMGVALLLVFSYRLGWFPTGGTYSGRTVTPGWTLEFLADVLHHAALPIASFVITVFGILALLMRGNAISILGDDYIRVAELRGLPERHIALGYLGRNAILPMYTEFMLSIGFMFGGSIVMEQIFRYPGLGFRMLKAISARDYPLLMGIFLVITLAVVVCIFIADMTYSYIDPRISVGDQQ